jgi:hypothetical protein
VANKNSPAIMLGHTVTTGSHLADLYGDIFGCLGHRRYRTSYWIEHLRHETSFFRELTTKTWWS